MDLAAFIKQERDAVTAFEDWWCEGHNDERRNVEKYKQKASHPLSMEEGEWQEQYAMFRSFIWPTL